MCAASETGRNYPEIDCFGQGEAQRISQQAQSNPLALLEYLDRFIDLSVAKSEEETARKQLLDLQTEIESTEQKVDQIPGAERALAVTKQQLQALQKPDVKELIDLQRKLAQEKQVRTQITDLLNQAKRGSSTALTSLRMAHRAMDMVKHLVLLDTQARHRFLAFNINLG